MTKDSCKLLVLCHHSFLCSTKQAQGTGPSKSYIPLALSPKKPVAAISRLPFSQISGPSSQNHRFGFASDKQETESMPAEILSRLESILPNIEASLAKNSKGSSRRTESSDILEFEMRAMRFIWNLPIISIDYLHWDEKVCGLCNKKYDDEFKVCGRGESPCHLPCGHIAGHQCLREHLSPYENGSTKCPFLGCNVDFPQMFTDPVEPKQATSDLALVDIDEADKSDGELSGQVSQLSNDSGASSDEIKRFLSIDEVLARSRNETKELNMGIEARDFATEASVPPEIRTGEIPKTRRLEVSPTPASATTKAVDLIAKNF